MNAGGQSPSLIIIIYSMLDLRLSNLGSSLVRVIVGIVFLGKTLHCLSLPRCTNGYSQKFIIPEFYIYGNMPFA